MLPSLKHLAALLFLTCSYLAGACFVEAQVLESEKPNIIVINLDDADSELFELSFSDVLFPNIMSVAQQGISFNNLHVTTPLCGPSRACFYRAQYAHNTGIRANNPTHRLSHKFEGGFDFYRRQGFLENDLSTWMKDAGYRTMLVGKYLHEGFVKPNVPPGWDDFYVSLGGRYYGTFQFTNATEDNGSYRRLDEDTYRTNAEADDCLRLIQEHADRGDDQPFFLHLNPYGPHTGSTFEDEMIDRRMSQWWERASTPFSPAINEPDTSDKRGMFANLPLFSNVILSFINSQYRLRLLATRSVDDMVGRLERKLSELGLEESTYIFITSDNGFLLGHNRAFAKGLPVDRSSRVPLFVKGPGVPAERQGNQLLGHIDLAPTIVDLAGGQVPDFVDGRSFARLLNLDGFNRSPTFRATLLIENWVSTNQFGTVEYSASTSVRTSNTIYTEWATGGSDYFDLNQDPEQLENTYDELSADQKLFLHELLRIQKNSTQKAFATFAFPVTDGQTISAGAPLEGLADSASGVRQVRLAIYDSATRQYWDGLRWQDGLKQVYANLQNREGQVTVWDYASVPRFSASSKRKIFVWAWAYDEDLGFAPPTVTSYFIDQERPSVQVESPRQNETFQNTVNYSGTVTGSENIEEIRLFIRERSSGRYLKDLNTFVTTPTPQTVSPNGDGEWSFSVELPPGEYALNVRAFDELGNNNEFPPFRHYRVIAR